MAGYWQRSALREWADRWFSCFVYLRGLLLSLLLVAALSPCDSLAQAEPEPSYLLSVFFASFAILRVFVSLW